jgi:hypothetical protein
MIKCKVRYNLLDARDFRYVVVPEEQDWAARESLIPAAQSGLQRMATLLPINNFTAKVAIEQSMEEHQIQAGVEVRLFESKVAAHFWLLEHDTP